MALAPGMKKVEFRFVVSHSFFSTPSQTWQLYDMWIRNIIYKCLVLSKNLFQKQLSNIISSRVEQVIILSKWGCMLACITSGYLFDILHMYNQCVSNIIWLGWFLQPKCLQANFFLSPLLLCSFYVHCSVLITSKAFAET